MSVSAPPRATQTDDVGLVDSPGANAPRGRQLDAVTLVLFTTAIFSSATLLFVVQPMVGKILLPKLGGAPAVWNTCMVFFQATLLAGYLSAHLLTKYCPMRVQVAVFAAGLFAAFWSLPISVGPEWVDRLLAGSDPNAWLLSALFCRVAPVFFVLSITSPLMQKWFARSGHRQSEDPYFLYAASNVGSILALLLYPLAIEVHLGVAAQTTNWMYGFGFFAVLATVCGLVSIYGSRGRLAETSADDKGNDGGNGDGNGIQSKALTWRRRAFWVLLAFIPSSLMLGVTTYISTDVSSIPLIWVIPLTMYLVTFVFAFSKRQIFSPYWMGRIGSLLLLAIMVTVVTGANHPPVVIVPMHLLMFFAVAMFCHQRLAADRPTADHLTDFYLWMSVGGVIGGLFNALLAPSLFVTIIEYPLVMVLASYLRTTRGTAVEHAAFDSKALTKLAGFGIAIVAMVLGMGYLMDALFAAGEGGGWLASLVGSLPLHAAQLRTLIVFGVPAAFVLRQMENRNYFTLGLASLLLLSAWNRYSDDGMLARDRNFYGTVATAHEKLAGGEVVKMFHGNTVHGWQWLDAERKGVPLTYYGKSSGVGKLIDAKQQASTRPLNIGAVGLGAGTMAAALDPGDTMRYYEINPQVVDHAETYFTYLSDARERGSKLDIKLGDARLVLEAEAREAGGNDYDILIIDAFSSDSIPAHLITNECFQTYLSHIRQDGVLAIHITNRYLNLEPVLGAVAAENGLAGYSYEFRDIAGGHAFDEKTGETASHWVLLSREESTLADLRCESDMKRLISQLGYRMWTDDYSNVMSAFESR